MLKKQIIILMRFWCFRSIFTKFELFVNASCVLPTVPITKGLLIPGPWFAGPHCVFQIDYVVRFCETAELLVHVEVDRASGGGP
jgi:hypothetical protein